MKTYLQTRNNDIFDVFGDFFRPMFYDEKQESMRTDIRESEQGYTLDIELPGFEKNMINVTLESGYLTVSAKKEAQNEEKGEHYLRRECHMSCRRSYYVGEDVEQENIRAKYENGVLSLTVPKTSPKKLESKTIAVE